MFQRSHPFTYTQIVALSSTAGAVFLAIVLRNPWAGLAVMVIVLFLLLLSVQGSARNSAEPFRGEREAYRQLFHYAEDRCEQERARLARELHDDLGQRLTAAKMMLGAISSADSLAAVGKAAETIDGAIRTTRGICSRVRPAILDQLGLVPALEWLTNQLRQEKVGCQMTNSAGELSELTEHENVVIFRIVESVLSGFSCNSAATIQLSLERSENEIRLEIQNREILPFAGEPLQAMAVRERAASIGAEVETTAGKDARFVLSLPLANRVLPA